MAIFAKGYLEEPERWYVFANVENPSKDDTAAIEGALAAFGKKTSLTFIDVAYGDPRPHFMASGLGEQITASLSAYTKTVRNDPTSN